MSQSRLGGSFRFPGTDLVVNRMGYGAMQLAGPHIWGPPKDRAQAIAVLRTSIESGVNHIDTSDFYGPHVTNQIIREALSPYPDDLVIVSKVGALRGSKGEWLPAQSPAELKQAIYDNLKNLGLERIDVINLRLMGSEQDPSAISDDSIAERFTALVELQQQGLVRHLGLSNASRRQIDEALTIAPIICVQNFYNLARRHDDSLIDYLATKGIAYVPYFPLGGFTPLQSSTLDTVAEQLKITPMQTALAWLLQRAENLLLIPGTSSLSHLNENLAAAQIQLPTQAVERLNQIAG